MIGDYEIVVKLTKMTLALLCYKIVSEIKQYSPNQVPRQLLTAPV